MGNILFWTGLVLGVVSFLVAMWFIYKKDNKKTYMSFAAIVVAGVLALVGLSMMPEGGEDVDVNQEPDVEQSTELNRDLGEDEDVEEEDVEEEESVADELGE